MPRLSLKYRIAATIFVLEAIMIGLMLWTTLSMSNEASLAKQEARNESVMGPLSELSRVALLNDEYVDLQTYITFLPKVGGALQVYLADVLGNVVAGSNISELGKPMPPTQDRGEHYWQTRDLVNETGRLGRLAVQFSNASLDAANLKSLLLGLCIAFLGMTVIAVVGVTMGQLLTRRLDLLNMAANKFASGDWDYKIELQGDDEIAAVGHAFNRMATLLRQHIREIEESRERYTLAVSGTNDGIWDWDVEKGRVYYSPTFKAMLGFDESDPHFSESIDCWKDRVHPDDYPFVVAALLDYLEGRTGCFVSEHRIRRKTGEYMFGLMRAKSLNNSLGEPVRLAGSLTDVTMRKQFEDKMHHQALHDALTGLPNRLLLEDRLESALHSARRGNKSLTVMMMDLDRFKDINDTLGHSIGDQLLQQVASRIGNTVREGDTLSRFGGDEFVMVLPDTNTEQAVVVAAKILDSLRPPLTVENHNLLVEASLGAAVFPADGVDADTLIKRADVAMYASKRGRLGYSFYHNESDQHSLQRLSLISELHHAIHAEELVLYFQPKLNLRSGLLYGVEALVRWQHPKRGLVGPNEFIPLAEESGLIAPLTCWVLENSLLQLHAWQQAGMELTVAVNVSTRALQHLSFPDDIEAQLLRWKVDSRWLELEITESTIMSDPNRAMQVLHRLDAMGVQLSIDDFGTGYSSLAYLKQLPVDEVKIDRSFVMDMIRDPGSLAIVRATIDLGHHLGILVIAEGVEDKESLDQLKALQCDCVQGYFIRKPQPAALAIDAIRKWNRETESAEA